MGTSEKVHLNVRYVFFNGFKLSRHNEIHRDMDSAIFNIICHIRIPLSESILKNIFSLGTENIIFLRILQKTFWEYWKNIFLRILQKHFSSRYWKNTFSQGTGRTLFLRVLDKYFISAYWKNTFSWYWKQNGY